MTNLEILNNEYDSLIKNYSEQWKSACLFEGADETAIAVEFSPDNEFAKKCVKIMKEIFTLKATIEYMTNYEKK